MRACTICAAALPHGPRPVFRLHPSARILVAGQAPGRRVHASGIPFDDPSGDRLRAWLGVDRAQFYDERQIAILPMGFCYPGTGSSGDLPPRKECAPAWREQLLARLPKLEFTLAIGQYAIAYHLPDASGAVTDAVRDWKRAWPHTVALPHPSPRNNIWLSKHPWFEAEVVPAIRRRVRALLAR